MIWSIASSASLRAVADGDALALGQPRRLDDDRLVARLRTYSSAAVGSVNDRASAVGIACWRISSLANHLSASMLRRVLRRPEDLHARRRQIGRPAPPPAGLPGR